MRNLKTYIIKSNNSHADVAKFFISCRYEYIQMIEGMSVYLMKNTLCHITFRYRERNYMFDYYNRYPFALKCKIYYPTFVLYVSLLSDYCISKGYKYSIEKY